MSHRKPPIPKHFYSTEPGVCKWCNKPVNKLTEKLQKPSKSRWHDKCLRDYKFFFWPKETRKEVFRRDKGVCAHCGVKRKKAWHVDHVKPLVEAKGHLKYWKLSNLQTLCHKCHKAKTAKENSQRNHKG